MKDELINKYQYELLFLLLWFVVSTLLFFGTIIMEYVSCSLLGTNLQFPFIEYLISFYGGIGVIMLIFYLFGFIYIHLESKNPTKRSEDEIS